MKWNEIPKFKEFGIINPANMGFISYVNFIKGWKIWKRLLFQLE